MTYALRDATRRDLDASATLFGAAFEDTPQWRWMIEDDETRSDVLPAFFKASLRHTLRRGRLVLAERVSTGSLAGVAAWLPPGRWQVPAWRGSAAPPGGPPPGGRAARAECATRGRAIDSAAKAAHPAEPHWYLAGVAVSPSAQGEWIGSQLIRDGLDRLDGPAYLECEEALVSYYERFGFRVTQRIDPGDSVPVQIGMWRPA